MKAAIPPSPLSGKGGDDGSAAGAASICLVDVPLGRPGGDIRLVCGVDEAGRGPLAGPVYAAAVILDPARPIDGLADSKKLSEPRRERLALEIRDRAAAFGIAFASVEEIDRLNILRATHLAMRRAVEALGGCDHLLVDGRPVPGLPAPSTAIVRGDSASYSIAAASIVAKVQRDRIMDDLDCAYPSYGFARHRGYGTAAHLAALARFGPCPAHRRSFAPVAQQLLAL